jgi:hypothetical protein
MEKKLMEIEKNNKEKAGEMKEHFHTMQEKRNVKLMNA